MISLDHDTADKLLSRHYNQESYAAILKIGTFLTGILKGRSTEECFSTDDDDLKLRLVYPFLGLGAKYQGNQVLAALFVEMTKAETPFVRKTKVTEDYARLCDLGLLRVVSVPGQDAQLIVPTDQLLNRANIKGINVWRNVDMQPVPRRPPTAETATRPNLFRPGTP
jgi:hypothetical protein